MFCLLSLAVLFCLLLCFRQTPRPGSGRTCRCRYPGNGSVAGVRYLLVLNRGRSRRLYGEGLFEVDKKSICIDD